MKVSSINYFLFIESCRKLVRSLTFYKFFSNWRTREKRKFHELYNQGNLEEAISFGEIALSKRESDYNLRKSLAVAYRGLGYHDIANLKLREGLIKVSGMNPDIILTSIQNDITKVLGNLEVKSKIIDLGGWRNYCQVQHQTTDLNFNKKLYITKVSTPKKTRKERYFYTRICEKEPVLKSIVPNFVKYSETENGKLAFLTLDKISGNQVQLEHINLVVNAHELLSSIRLNLVPNDFNFSFNRTSKRSIIRNRNIWLSPSFFSAIHHQEANLIIVNWLYQRLSKCKNIQTSKSLIAKLESIVLKKRIYEKIVPSKHFSFVHGDFVPHNMLADDQNGKIYILDWAEYFFGPTKYDMVRFLESFSLQFNAIKEKYIDHIVNEKCNESMIETSLFIYLLILSWFKEKSIDRVLEKNQDYLGPAIDYLEYLINKID